MAVAAAPNALVTAAEAMAILGTGTLTGDDLDNLQRQINSASAWIENWLQVPTIMKHVTEQQPGAVKRLYLRSYPVLTVISIADPAGNTIPTTDYYVENDKGILVHFGRFWVAQTTQGQPCRWAIQTIAGWWAGNRQITGSAGAGTFTVGQFIYVGAAWASATKRGAITRVAGTTAAPVITYCLLSGATDFANADAVKEYTGSVDGDGTCTAGTPADAAYADEDVKTACIRLVSLARDGATTGVRSVGVGSLSVSYGSASAGFSDSPDVDRGFMPADVIPLLSKYRGNMVSA